MRERSNEFSVPYQVPGIVRDVHVDFPVPDFSYVLRLVRTLMYSLYGGVCELQGSVVSVEKARDSGAAVPRGYAGLFS